MSEGGPQELVGADARGRHLTLGPFLSLKSSSSPDVNYRFDGTPIYATSAGNDSVIAVDGRVVVHLTPASSSDDGSTLMVSRIAGGDDEAGGEDRDSDVPDGADEQRRDGMGAEARFTFDLRCPAPAGEGVVYVVDGDRIRKLQLAPQQHGSEGPASAAAAAAAATEAEAEADAAQGPVARVTTLALAGWEPRAIWGLVHVPAEHLAGAAHAGPGGCLVFSTDTALYGLPLPLSGSSSASGGSSDSAADADADAADAAHADALAPQLLAGHPSEAGAGDGAGADARFTSIRIGLALDGEGGVLLLDQRTAGDGSDGGHTAIRRVSAADGAVSTLGVLTETFSRPAVLPGSGCLAAVMTHPQRAVSVIDLGMAPPRLLGPATAVGGGGGDGGGGGAAGATPGKAHARAAEAAAAAEEGAGGSGGHKRRRK
ncbi:hypothetical protein HYH02_003101 [Chlamydomonas schloesseri]|uniref:Uncharacterized protein n=1 Tax=Chlamydomonas schloesseri TaxID=2026947 RepID=A0A835WQX9_9CHLO|nr:hypothetical protein HYH02_003101 [Chlamydomonas schloesseri]|eukprot:KAG2452065.1 hypothetical protein HYH02_003101 [Chlamydomonas schloesseri]